MEFRTNPLNNDKFIDVSYSELVEDSHAVLTKIYAKTGETIGPKLTQIFKQTEANSTKGKYGAHHYDLNDFGIDESFINKLTAGYQDYQQSLRIQ